MRVSAQFESLGPIYMPMLPTVRSYSARQIFEIKVAENAYTILVMNGHTYRVEPSTCCRWDAVATGEN